MFLVLVVVGEHGIFLTTKISGFTVRATFFCFVSKTGVVISWMWVDSQLA